MAGVVALVPIFFLAAYTDALALRCFQKPASKSVRATEDVLKRIQNSPMYFGPVAGPASRASVCDASPDWTRFACTIEQRSERQNR